MATVPHVTSGLGLRKFQAYGFFFDTSVPLLLLQASWCRQGPFCRLPSCGCRIVPYVSARLSGRRRSLCCCFLNFVELPLRRTYLFGFPYIADFKVCHYLLWSSSTNTEVILCTQLLPVLAIWVSLYMASPRIIPHLMMLLECMRHAVTHLFEATNRKVAGSIPDGVIGIFYWHKPSGRTSALGSTQPPTEMSNRNISWGLKAAGT